MESARNPILTVVIPTLGRPIIIKTLNSLVATEHFDEIEVHVAGRIADEKVNGQLQAIVVEHPNIHHFDVQFDIGDSSEKKNTGWRAAQTDIVAFLDDDVFVAPDWPSQILKPFDDEQVGGASGPSLVPPDVGWFAHLAGVALQSKAAGYVSERYLRGGDDAGVRKVGWSRIIGCNMAYRRSVLEQINGFEPEFWPGEEMLAAFRAEQQSVLMFSPEAWVYHYPRISFGKFWKQMHGYGATRIRLIRAGVEFEPTTVVPAAWVLSLLLLFVAGFFSAWAGFLLTMDLLLYLMADIWISWSKYKETRRFLDLGIFFLVPFMHLSYGLAEWVEVFRPNKDLSEGR